MAPAPVEPDELMARIEARKARVGLLDLTEKSAPEGRGPGMIAVNANVMVYLLTGAGPGEKAAALLEKDPEWTGPTLLLSEVRNVLAGLVRSHGLAPGPIPWPERL